MASDVSIPGFTQLVKSLEAHQEVVVRVTPYRHGRDKDEVEAAIVSVRPYKGEGWHPPRRLAGEQLTAAEDVFWVVMGWRPGVGTIRTKNAEVFRDGHQAVFRRRTA